MEEKKMTKRGATVEETAAKPKTATSTAAKKPVQKSAAEAKPVQKTAAAAKPTAKKTAAPKTKSATAAAKKPAAKKTVENTDAVNVTAAKDATTEFVKVEPVETVAQPTETKQAQTASRKKVLFVASEVLPYAGTGGLGEVAGSLPAAVTEASEKGYDVRVIMPYYVSVIAPEWKEQIRFVNKTVVSLAWRSQYCGVFETVRNGVTYYFIDNEYYFKRNGLYGHYDDGERFAFFSKAVLDVLPLIDFFPDVIHCNDWQTALVPIYYKLYYMYQYKYDNVKVVFTIHNIEYQGKFGKECCEDLFGIPGRECTSISKDNCINLMKGAIDYCDALTTVSPTYATEIMSDYFAHGLAVDIAHNRHKLSGILNGIDTIGYDSTTDQALFVNFGEETLDVKKQNKTELQKMLNLTVDEKVPMIAVISRLVSHKGMDLIKAVSHDLMAQDVQFVVLGTGNAEYEAFFTHLQSQYPTKMAAVIAYNKDLSRKIYGAADIFLMPSKSEPCGLSQMIASRYATVPIVRETGGLYDSIKDCNDGTQGNGYTFSTYNAGDMKSALDRALGLYRFYPEIWQGLMKRILREDFSWGRSAKEYIKMYDALIGDKT